MQNEKKFNDETKVCRECGKEQPITAFKLTQKGNRSSVCNACVRAKYMATKRAKCEGSGAVGLAAFTPRQLMEELARRGYTGKLRITQIHEIDITNF